MEGATTAFYDSAPALYLSPYYYLPSLGRYIVVRLRLLT
jgi:hypothetical protein